MKLLTSISTFISNVFYIATTLILDLLFTLGNLVRPSRPVGKVTPEGQPGYGGIWPEYRAPKEGDSRSACPGLNAMANHGILPRNGRGIKFTQVPQHIDATFNFSSTLSSAITHFAASMLKKSYSEDSFDLEEVSLHNGIEHDASLTRLDTALEPNQAVTHPSFIEELFSFATGKDATGKPLLTINDLSRILGKRRIDCRAVNKEYSLGLFHKLFSSANSSMLSTIFGGRVDDLRVILPEERLPQGWESRVRTPYGITIFTHNLTSIRVELGVREADWTLDARRAVGPANKAVEEDA